jgi:hypothetical protein
MRLSKRKLQRIIREEVRNQLNEASYSPKSRTVRIGREKYVIGLRVEDDRVSLIAEPNDPQATMNRGGDEFDFMNAVSKEFGIDIYHFDDPSISDRAMAFRVPPQEILDLIVR